MFYVDDFFSTIRPYFFTHAHAERVKIARIPFHGIVESAMSLRSTITVTSLLFLVAAPLIGQAATKKLDLYNPKKKYGDEKTAIQNPASRCTTAVFQKMYKDAVTQAEKDIAALKVKKGGTLDSKTESLAKSYLDEITLAWQVMHEPYCGFGAFGATAAQKSLKKTLTRARANFLAGKDSGVRLETVALKPESATIVRTVATPASTTTVPVVPVPPPAVAQKKVVPPSHYALTQVLKKGSRAKEVAGLQAMLVEKGLLDPEYATGYFGSYTESALIAFQLKQKIIATRTAPGAGTTGPKTRAALLR